MTRKPKMIVNSFNEWDPLEEVIVGTIDYATIPPLEAYLKASVPKKHWDFFKKNYGTFFSKDLIEKAKDELDQFVHILEQEGVTVKRPEALDQSKEFSTPDWKSPCGLYQAMPRDLLLVVGNEIIETPLAWRCRHYEIHSYRKLLKEYFQKGAKWTAAPKPQLLDELYEADYKITLPESNPKYAISEFEPTFDGADFIRFGKDIFVQQSNVTNLFGIEWLQRHLGDTYKIHILEFEDTHPMHSDASLVPLAPGHILVNPERLKKIPRMFKSWNIIYAPPSCLPARPALYFSSPWLSMNILMLDEKRVVVEPSEEPLIQVLKKNGFTPVICPFRHFNSFGGAFHCATMDVRRKGTLQSYF